MPDDILSPVYITPPPSGGTGFGEPSSSDPAYWIDFGGGNWLQPTEPLATPIPFLPPPAPPGPAPIQELAPVTITATRPKTGPVRLFFARLADKYATWWDKLDPLVRAGLLMSGENLYRVGQTGSGATLGKVVGAAGKLGSSGGPPSPSKQRGYIGQPSRYTPFDPKDIPRRTTYDPKQEPYKPLRSPWTAPPPERRTGSPIPVLLPWPQLTPALPKGYERDPDYAPDLISTPRSVPTPAVTGWPEPTPWPLPNVTPFPNPFRSPSPSPQPSPRAAPVPAPMPYFAPVPAPQPTPRGPDTRTRVPASTVSNLFAPIFATPVNTPTPNMTGVPSLLPFLQGQPEFFAPSLTDAKTDAKTSKCSCPKPEKKKKPREPREVCWTGTYREKSKSTSKSRRRKIPCQ